MATPASARPSHHHGRHAHAHHAQHHHVKKHRHVRRHRSHRHRARHVSRWDAGVRTMKAQRLHTANASMGNSSEGFGGSGFSMSNVVSEARRYIGRGNPTGRSRLWCARFMNMVLQRSGHQGTGSDMARSFASYGRRVSGPQVGAIAVMSRGRRGGHVGVVSGIDAQGNPIIISGNHGHRVAEAKYSRGRVYAYVMPN
ncbi:TIGR02594 family protein [Afipia sp. Root123D2]|uniref:TIGR02594 family protein n=1 Tax=Afipia sp. Root123D2 TaxID=1736436 RepID=UPI001FCE204A|nr:TIGR02594 family protein [Afipia sp. Root123D2]